jgi:hypothetical protein
MDAYRECSQTFQVWAGKDSLATPFPDRSIKAAEASRPRAGSSGYDSGGSCSSAQTPRSGIAYVTEY